mgnify:FL=1
MESISTKVAIVQYGDWVVLERVEVTAFCMSPIRDP